MDASTRTATSAPPVPGRTPRKGNAWFLTLTAVGIVFGDIGTSPLYTFSVTLGVTGHAVPTAADVLGIVSLIFWALMAMVSLKYVVLVLRADNDGEGGILALLSLVVSERTGDGRILPFLVALGITGAALLYGDGSSRRRSRAFGHGRPQADHAGPELHLAATLLLSPSG
jgi:KUP system potassium uptake protein